MPGGLRDTRLAAIVFALTSLLSLSWYRLRPIVFWDGGLPFVSLTRTPQVDLYSLLRYYVEGLNPHLYPPQPITQSSLIYVLELNALHFVLPIWASQFAATYAMVFLGQLGVYYFTSWLASKAGFTPPLWAIVVGASLYVFSPMYQFVFGDGSISYVNVWCTYPAMLYILVRLPEKWVNKADYLKLLLALYALGALASIDYSYFEYVGENLALLMGATVLVASYVGPRRLGPAMLGFLGLQSSYTYFLWRDALIAPTVAGQGAPLIVSAYQSYFNYASSLNSYFRQLTYYYWPVGQPGYPMLPNVPQIAVSPIYGVLLVTCLAAPLLLEPRGRRLYPVYLLFLVFVALGAGSNPPFNWVANTLYAHLWVYRAFTEPFLAVGFTVELAGSVLIALGLGALSSHAETRGRLQVVAALLLVGVLVSSGFTMLPYATGAPSPILPLFSSPNGDINYTAHNVTPRITIPAYYYSLVDYLNRLPQRGAVLLLPIEGNLYTSTWYVSTDMLSQVLNKPVVTGGYLDFYPGLVDAVYEWTLGYPVNITRILVEAGVGYIVLQGDITYGDLMDETPYYNFTYIQRILDNTQGISQIARIGPDTVYEVAGQTNTWYGSQASGPPAPEPQSGFTVYPLSDVVGLQPSAQHPYLILVNITGYMVGDRPAPTDVDLAGCGGGNITFKWTPIVHGLDLVATPSCQAPANMTFKANFKVGVTIKANTTIYLTYGYTFSGAKQNLTVTLNGAQGEPGPVPISAAPGWAYYAYPASNYTWLSVTVGGSAKAGQNLTYTILDAYVSLGVDQESLLTSANSVYVLGKLNKTSSPSVAPNVYNWSCSTLECSATMNSSGPFLLVWYTPYSESYTLNMDGAKDSWHLEALGAFNAWVVNHTGTVTLKAKWTNPNWPWDIIGALAWLLPLVAYVATITSQRTRRRHNVQDTSALGLKARSHNA